jgi:hypothetical protein
MKKLFVVLVMLVAMNVNGQWQPNVLLSNYSIEDITSNNSAWSVAANGNIVHVVWQDRRDGYDIYYKRSTDGGTNWGADILLTVDSTAYAGSPALTVSGQYVHVAWIDHRFGSNQIFYKRSTDNGTSWGVETKLTYGNTGALCPSVAVSASFVHIVFNQYLNGYSQICYKRSTDGGTSWGADTWLTNNSPGTFSPSVAVNGTLVQVAWSDSRDGNFEIYHKRSTDSGANWGADTRLTNTTATSYMPTVAIAASLVQVVWQEYINGKWQLNHIRSTDGGTSWGTISQLTNSTGSSFLSNLAVSASIVHLVWSDIRDLNYEIYYKRSTNSGISWGADTRLTNDTNSSLNPSVAISGSVVHVVWRGIGVYYKRNPTGNVGIQNISTEIPSKYSLGQNYPNPFNSTSNLKFQIANFVNAKIVVYDIQGREVQTLVNETLQPGTYETTFDGSNLSSGIYFYKLIAGDFTETKRLTLLK